ncbi:Ditrans,polycis-undecaprenyl-diphosphate synthase ((2E,6E)-farnesyl-diphosphate specific) [Methanosarcinaceae archaeon Ag5]|uniref:Tritrans,polycis-undecaprenyl-diphosphate synthase (geranylgeranyl-diphosphate specific) n=1 Tax=Methanolapillus africanus TaxID=3028297 RepID=A0AAE4MH90_9EURY|nr:Ditrans,polycis-undecaprenyl-diphosphate synthase ((2E,6E)-farnesyl-diphosphate specific) [Methanosarcinaceae archaeon Ag5]
MRPALQNVYQKQQTEISAAPSKRLAAEQAARKMFVQKKIAAPEHIAFIMDGNRRFARQKGQAPAWGHRMGTQTMEKILQWAYLSNIKYMTVYAFSTENFKRDQDEVNNIFELLEKTIRRLSEDEKVQSKSIKIRMIGDASPLPERIRNSFLELEEKTKHNNKMCLNVAIAYGGRQDITQAFLKIAQNAESDTINDAEIAKYLFPFSDETVPDVDLLIRTGGENRTSNFLPWQANGNDAVVVFHQKYWPEFNLKDLLGTLRRYQKIVKERDDAKQKRLERIDEFLG